jgi:hypothetical protein
VRAHLVLAFQVRGGVWVQINGPNTRADRDRMLRLGRALDFNKSTPLHTPVSLARAPDELPLVEFDLGNASGAAVADWSVDLKYSDRSAESGSPNSVTIVVARTQCQHIGRTGARSP